MVKLSIMVETLVHVEPCPFCKGEEFVLKKTETAKHFVSCASCRADGPLALTEEKAVDLWNRRG